MTCNGITGNLIDETVPNPGTLDGVNDAACDKSDKDICLFYS